MIRYTPPKSQVWGHQVGRLTATGVVDRGLRFLDEQCTIIDSQPCELMIGWNSTQDALLSTMIAEVDQALGASTSVNQLPAPAGRGFYQRRWPFPSNKLREVASWFEQLGELLKTQEVVAQSSTFWVFAWRDEAPPLRPLESAGGMFGIHLGRPHRITTTFTFRDLERYQAIQSYLAELGLAELSDKHLRPKVHG